MANKNPVDVVRNLENVTTAFRWIAVYYEDISKLFKRIELEFGKCKTSFIPLNEGSLYFLSSKLLAQPEQWASTYHLQYFYPSQKKKGSSHSLLALHLQHNSTSNDQSGGPQIQLICLKSTGNLKKMLDRNLHDMTSIGDFTNAKRNGVLSGHTMWGGDWKLEKKRVYFTFHKFFLSEITSLEQVMGKIVMPMEKLHKKMMSSDN